MLKLHRLYRTINLLSLDVVLGAVISSLYFTALLEVKPNEYSTIALGLTVWIIYTADRLLDVRKLKNQPATERHKFHQRYQKQLWVMIALMGMIVVALAFFLHQSVLAGGIFLSVVICIYLAFQKNLHIKEFVVAILYTLGVLLPALGVFTGLPSAKHYLLIAQFFTVVLINLLLFSWFECESDRSEGYSSFVTVYGKKVTLGLLFVLIFCSISITGCMLIQRTFNFITFTMLFMTLTLLIITLFPGYYSINSRYRLLGDAIFFLPALGLL